MTPEEFDKSMEFILDSQAGVLKGFQLLTQDISDLRESTAQFESLAADLITIQSQRMDRMDQFHEGLQQQIIELQRQALHILNLILDRLPASPSNPS